MQQLWRSFKKLKIELPYDPAILLLGIYLEKTIIQKDTCTPMFIAALFTVTRTWKQPKYPLTDEQVNKMWSIYTTEYYCTIKKNEMMLFASTWMDLEIIILSQISQIKTNPIWFHLNVESKIWHKWIYGWNGNADTENSLLVVKGEGGMGGMKWKFGINRCKLLCRDWTNDKVLCIAQETTFNVLW